MQHVFWKKYDICGSFSNCKHQLPNSEGEKKAEEESWMRRIVWLENTRGSLWKWSAINIRESVGPRFKFYCDLFSVVHYPRRRGGRRRKRRKRSRKIFAATTSVSPLVFLHRTASSLDTQLVNFFTDFTVPSTLNRRSSTQLVTSWLTTFKWKREKSEKDEKRLVESILFCFPRRVWLITVSIIVVFRTLANGYKPSLAVCIIRPGETYVEW